MLKNVKQILVIDETSLFREYLELKLTENNIQTTTAISSLDGISRLRNTIPDLLIIDYNLSRQGCLEVLKQKKASPGLAPIPVIVTARQPDQKKILELVPYNVKKVFSKPVKIDALLATIQELLGVAIDMDKKPGIVEVHVNDDIIFIEITEGLNRDKLDLLKFKIAEHMALYQIRIPKLIIMISGFTLSSADDTNILRLLNNVLGASKAKQQNVRILTNDQYVRTFIRNHKAYETIEVVSNLQYALDGLLKGLENVESGEHKAVLIGDKVLSAENAEGESVQLRFDGEIKLSLENIKESLRGLHIAAVDDDEIIRELIKHTFSGFNIELNVYSNGAEFISALDTETFDLIMLDLLMPRVDGFAVLRELKDRAVTAPVIILSAVNQQETMIRAFQMGVKSYLVKPLKPTDIFKKAMEILRVNF